MKPGRSNLLYLSINVLTVLLTAHACLADDRAKDRATLRGIKTVVVKVHTFERDWFSELSKAGLTEAVLQATIERQLEKSGLAVVPEEASKRTVDEGILNLRLNLSDPEPSKKSFLTSNQDEIKRVDPNKRYVYALRLNLRQQASLRRIPGETIMAITWQTESVGMRRLAVIREDFQNVVDVFIQAYASENPRN